MNVAELKAMLESAPEDALVALAVYGMLSEGDEHIDIRYYEDDNTLVLEVETS